jgi:hypothetical protein
MKFTSLGKSLQIVDLVCKNPQRLSLLELYTMLDYPKSTIHHILNAFLPHDYVAKEPEMRKYSLGFKFPEGRCKGMVMQIFLPESTREEFLEGNPDSRQRWSGISRIGPVHRHSRP